MYDGLEVDMLSVGDADCLLVTRWDGFTATRVLIDGGNATDFSEIRSFLKQRSVTYLDALVSTHGHDDHAGGLLKLIEDKSIGLGRAFVHVPQNHLNMTKVERALKIAAGSKEAETVKKTMETAIELLTALYLRGIPVAEPFAGTDIAGFLTVVGPSQAYYEELVQEFEDADALRRVDESNQNSLIESLVEDAFVETGLIEASLLDNPQTSPENNSSVIMATIFGDAKYLFTSDAGAPALCLAAADYDLTNCFWSQIPHHGSHRNITKALVELFYPKVAYVSAEGSKKHPRRSVVNAFKEVGAQVYSTHYPVPTHLRNYRGVVPSRINYGPAIPLYEKSKSQAA